MRFPLLTLIIVITGAVFLPMISLPHTAWLEFTTTVGPEAMLSKITSAYTASITYIIETGHTFKTRGCECHVGLFLYQKKTILNTVRLTL